MLVLAVALLSGAGMPPTDRPYTPPEDGLTRVHIDGDPSDWASYPAIYADPVGDSTGNVDITYVYSFTNDTYVYFLFEVAGEIGSYVQLDVDITTTNHREGQAYMINARPYENERPHIFRIEGKQLVDLGEQGDVAQGKAFEMRVPLEAFEGWDPESVAVRVMDGVCCGPRWITVDSTLPAKILHTEEVEPASAADLTAADSAFCRDETLAQPEAFKPISSISAPPGYRAEYFIAPSGLNAPSDVVVTPRGEILVASPQTAIHQVAPDGTVTTYAQLLVYSLDLDGEGTVYAYGMPTGEIYRLRPDGSSDVIARVPEAPYESTLAVAPEGTLYIGLNLFGDDTFSTSSILVVPPGGGATQTLVEGLESIIHALDVADGKLYATLGPSLVTVDPASGRTTPIARLPEEPSFHGLVVTDGGEAYVSTGNFSTAGHLYLVSPAGEVRTIATFEGNGLEGLALTPQGEILGTQRALGSLQAIDPESGSVRAVVPPNGLTTPKAMAISPCGELLTVNDESGRLTMATPDGRNRYLMTIVTFNPPTTHLAFAPAGWYVVGEAAPGFPSRLNRYLPNGSKETLVEDLPEVSGVAVGPDGSIYASSTLPDGQIIRLMPDGTREVLIDHLRTPQALALGDDGTLYAIIGGEGFGTVFATPFVGDTVISVGPDGSQAVLARLDHASALALGPDGLLYVAAGHEVYRIWPPGIAERFAEGFSEAFGLAFDVAGNLYVGDNRENAIVRISGFPASSLTVTVRDAITQLPLEGVRVRVVQSRPPFAGRMAITAADGTFSLPVAADLYDVTAWAEGYETTVLEGVEVEDQPVQITLTLKPLDDR